MKKIITKNYKYLIGLTVGIFISITIVYASSYFGAGSDLNYDNSESGLISTNVQDALEELHIVKKTGCPIGYTCEEKPPTTPATETITNLFNNGTKTTVTTAGGETITQVASAGLMQDSNGNIRYYGADPKNYVSFNNELWRIISIGNVKSGASDSTGETRIKLIKSTSYGSYAWNSSGTNDWSSASLKTTLNGTYYNSTLSADARNMIDDALYYLGGTSSYSDLYVDDYYTFERGTTVYSGRPTTWTGIVALMYASDYGYAADLNICTQSLVNYYNSNCKNTNWLKLGTDEWLLTQVAYSADGVFIASSNGDIYCSSDDLGVFPSLVVRPSVYLKSTVQISSGSGTSDDPYILTD